jgi:hypothetical protein
MSSLTKWLLFALAVVVVAVAGVFAAIYVIGGRIYQESINHYARHTAEYIRENACFPTKLSDLTRRSEDDDLEFYVDPRSDKYEASVWCRPRGGGDDEWFEGHSDNWDLESRPPPKGR